MEPGEIVGFVGGTIGIVKSAWDGYQWWKNRGRIDVRLLRLAYYVDRFGVGTRQVYQFPTDSSIGASMLDGKSKNAFTILEFEVTNSFK
jgi:hypothetical protein